MALSLDKYIYTRGEKSMIDDLWATDQSTLSFFAVPDQGILPKLGIIGDL